MLRALLAAVAAILLVGVLSLLIVESRSVKEDYYVAHAERMRAIEASRNDLNAILQGTQATFDDGRQVSSATALAFERLSENNTVLQNAGPRLRENLAVDEQLTTYYAEVASFVRSGETFRARQNAFAAALRELQEESPLVVKELRRFNLRLQSQNTFTLAIDVIEYATGDGKYSGRQLEDRIDELSANPTVRSQAPGKLDTFAAAAKSVISERSAAQLELRRIQDSRILETLWTLSNEILEDNRRTVSRAETARLLLSVCTVLLLVAGAYALYRLQASYRDLNNSNRELETVNDSLEERVDERTQELSSAYDELKESQVQLVQAEKMSSLGELVAGISHEINTPLWYLISNSTVLQERMEALAEFCESADSMIKGIRAGGDPKAALKKGMAEMDRMLKDGLQDDVEEAQDLIKDSIEGLEELTELAQSLKDFSRLDRARQGELNVNEGLDKTLLIAKNRLKSKVTVHKHYGEVPPIHCSPSQINQIFLNVLTNAADAIEESGDVVIRTVTEDESVRISFSDTGMGMPEDVIAKIRDPFFTTKEVGKGTGLGLSIVDQIITSHGGELIIESEQGKGTTVTIVLPIVAVDSKEDDTADTAANDAEVAEGADTDTPDADNDDEAEVETEQDVSEAAAV